MGGWVGKWVGGWVSGEWVVDGEMSEHMFQKA